MDVEDDMVLVKDTELDLVCVMLSEMLDVSVKENEVDLVDDVVLERDGVRTSDRVHVAVKEPPLLLRVSVVDALRLSVEVHVVLAVGVVDAVEVNEWVFVIVAESDLFHVVEVERVVESDPVAEEVADLVAVTEALVDIVVRVVDAVLDVDHVADRDALWEIDVFSVVVQLNVGVGSDEVAVEFFEIVPCEALLDALALENVSERLIDAVRD